MEINVKLFGSLIDVVGNNIIKIADATDVNTLITEMQKMHPALSDMKYAVALNKKIIQTNEALQPGTEVALLPPFSGG